MRLLKRALMRYTMYSYILVCIHLLKEPHENSHEYGFLVRI